MESNHTRLAKDGSLRVFFYFALVLMFFKHFGDVTSLTEGIPFIEHIAGNGLVVGIALFPAGMAYAIIWSISWLLKDR